ncbi:MAG: hypothetical protein LBL91_03080 [Lachnospiraceae bacterium]|nr:hypothetical protein [Lachnospiraceae bacterium]
MSIVNLLNIIIILLIVLIMGLGFTYFAITYKEKMKKNKKQGTSTEVEKKKVSDSGRFKENLSPESISKFMEFDEVKDGMIIRKNREQYVMVISCQGVNYDLMSQDEKIAVEEGFVQFLNTLRYPIQLYIQTRSLNLRDIVEGYKGRIKKMQEDIEKLEIDIKVAEEKENQDLIKKLKFQKRRKENVLEYGADISEYVARLSLNQNVLQQKTYIIVSYFAAESGSTSTYSKEEIDNICFSELYTRAQSVVRSLAASEVGGKVLDSEELAELLYIAYNRDDSELIQLNRALDAGYDALYSTSKDVFKKREEKINEELEEIAIDLATKSIIDADKELKKEQSKAKKIKEKAKELVEEYRDQMEDALYEKTKQKIDEENLSDVEEELELNLSRKA